MVGWGKRGERRKCRGQIHKLGYWLDITGQGKERAKVSGFKKYCLLPVADPVLSTPHSPYYSLPTFCSNIPPLSSPAPERMHQGVGVDLPKIPWWLLFLVCDWIRDEHMVKFLAKRSKGVGTTWKPTNEGMDKQNVAYYSTIKKEWNTLSWYNMDRPQNIMLSETNQT